MRSERGGPVESEIQIEHRHPRAAQEPQLSPLRVAGKQTANNILVEVARLCHAWDLQSRVFRTDVRVEPAA